MNKVAYFASGIIMGALMIGIGTSVKQQQPKPHPRHEIVFLWNDDDESIPKDGTMIMIQETVGDTIWIGPNDDEETYDYTN
jgi:hypothetical protein